MGNPSKKESENDTDQFSTLSNLLLQRLEFPELKAPIAAITRGLLSQQTLALTRALSPTVALSEMIEKFQEQQQARYENVFATMRSFSQSVLDQTKTLADLLGAPLAKRVAKVLRKHYWWPVPGLPPEFYVGILDLADNQNTRQTNRIICDWFRWNRYRRLGRMIRRWKSNPHFAQRVHIIRQAAKAHRRGDYNLSVPTLLPLIEGISKDFLVVSNLISRPDAIGTRDAIENAMQMKVTISTWDATILEAFTLFLTESTYVSTTKGTVLPSGYQLNRHGVLHGLHLHYGTEANSLRCFLWLETLYQCIEPNPEFVEWLT